MSAQVDWPIGLADIVNKMSYMPGWMARLARRGPHGAPALVIVSFTPDSYNHERMIRVAHEFLVPLASYNERTWKAWILECYVKVWRHETGEFLQFDGVREFAPHHGNGEDPYMTWHIGDLADTQVRAGEDKE